MTDTNYIEQHNALQKRAIHLENKRGELQGYGMTQGAVVSRLNSQIPNLLYASFVNEDATAEMKLQSIQAEINDHKLMLSRIHVLMTMLEQELGNVNVELDRIKPAFEEAVSRQKHWEREYDIALTKVNKMDGTNYLNAPKRLMECSEHLGFIKSLEAKEILKSKEDKAA